MDPSPVIALNRAIALSRWKSPEAGLAAIAEIQHHPALANYHWPHITNRHWSAYAPSPNAACSKNACPKTYTEYRSARTRACRVHTRVNARSQHEINSRSEE